MKKILLSFVVNALTFVSCNQNQKSTETKQEETVTQENNKHMEKSKKDCKDVHWTYEGEHGPEHWKDLCDGFADCGGKSQSPVDIQTGAVKKDQSLKAPEFHYGTTGIHIVNNGHTVQFNVSGDNTVKLEGKDYKLLQFHYHALSEHTVDGKHYPLEVHFVHKHNDKDFAVLGVMFKEGKENELLKQYLNHFPGGKGEIKLDGTIDLVSLFPSDLSYYRYEGSLTTPPCSEVVHWYVLKTPVEASKEQLEQFAAILKNNYRPVQPLNGRTIKLFNQH